METCNSCNQPIKHFYSQDSADILVVVWGAKPADTWDDEIKSVIKSEMFANRVPMLGKRLGFYSVWGHKPSERRSKLGKEQYVLCEETFRTQFFDLAKNKHILLYGSDAVKNLTNYKVSQVSGLAIPDSGFYWIAKSVYASEKLGKTFGELRLAIKRFSEFLQKSNTLEVQ